MLLCPLLVCSGRREIPDTQGREEIPPREGEIPHAGVGRQGYLASDCSGDPQWPVGPSAQSLHLYSRSLRAPGRGWADLGTPPSRRSLALADDAAFRERARLLAALERRRWLDSYMQKLLLLDAP